MISLSSNKKKTLKKIYYPVFIQEKLLTLHKTILSVNHCKELFCYWSRRDNSFKATKILTSVLILHIYQVKWWNLTFYNLTIVSPLCIIEHRCGIFNSIMQRILWIQISILTDFKVYEMQFLISYMRTNIWPDKIR